MAQISLSERITVDPAVLVGKPVIRGTRLSVEVIMGLLAEGWSHADIQRSYPGLAEEDILAYRDYARELVASERVFPTAA